MILNNPIFVNNAIFIKNTINIQKKLNSILTKTTLHSFIIIFSNKINIRIVKYILVAIQNKIWFGGYVASNKQHSRLRTVLKSRAFDVQVDAAGRIALPADQRAEVGVDKDVVIVGNTGYFEVWDAARYDEMSAEIDLGLLFS